MNTKTKLNVYDIPEYLSNLASEFDDSQNNKAHIVFVHLYKNVTEEWIHYADKTESRELILTIIEKFYQKYQNYVITQIHQRDIESTVDHWHTYFDLIGKRDPFRNLAHFFEFVYAGAFAHTRYDLAEAIEETLLAHPDICTNQRQLKHVAFILPHILLL